MIHVYATIINYMFTATKENTNVPSIRAIILF